MTPHLAAATANTGISTGELVFLGIVIIALVALFAWLGIPLLRHKHANRNATPGTPCGTCGTPLTQNEFCPQCDEDFFTLNTSRNRSQSWLLSLVRLGR